MAIVLFVAYFVRGITGFGSALVAVPLLTLTMPITVVVPIVVLLDYLASMSHGIKHFHHIEWRDLLPMLPFSVLGIVLALYLMNSLQPGLLTDALAVFILIYAVYSLLPLSTPQGSRFWAVPLGTLSGLISTLFGTGGPFTVIYLGLRKLEKNAFRGTVATFFAIDGGLRLIGFTASGFYNREGLLIALMALPIVALGLYTGGHIHTSLTRTGFVRIVAALLIVSSIALLSKSS
ncbi:MAG: sulfite exporter TauE/SafE family protein [Candidatus Thiodiazotropha sp. (ex Monitilora ramsayi)]|nr:sulfite exporter TauE/SafE family protein [Candidatus Thiodiazotropha sp. (ex Monitilora ramsayi)]